METNLSDVLGSEAVSTITASNSSVATTIRRATREIVTQKSGLLVHKRSKRSKKDDDHFVQPTRRSKRGNGRR